MKKNAAVIGYGGMGAGFHCKNLLTSDVCNLAGIYDIDPAKRELAASRGVKVYNTREELLADPTIDMVTIATPIYSICIQDFWRELRRSSVSRRLRRR